MEGVKQRPCSARFVQFLTEATGLRRKTVIELYNAGYPWPLWTAHDVRRAGILAQAKGLLFHDALEEARAMGEMRDQALFARIETMDRANGVTLGKRVQAMRSLPWFKESLDHIERVASQTTASPRTIHLLYMPIQRYAIDHPGFELVCEFPFMRRFLC